MKTTSLYINLFTELLSNNGAGLYKIYNANGKSLAKTKIEILAMIAPKVGHGVSVEAYKNLLTSMERQRTMVGLMSMLSCYMLAGEGMRAK